MRKDCLDYVRVVVDAQLIWDCREQRVGRSDRLVVPELLDENVGASAADRVCDCDDSVQWPNERNPIFYIAGGLFEFEGQ